MEQPPLGKSALQGVRILDLTRVLAGPWCTQNLADLGADVIKVERPDAGDDTRAWGPPYLEGTNEAAYFLAANRGKRSITLDIASTKGQNAIRQLLKHCDVVVENFKVGQLAKYGLDYPALKAIKPGLIFCSITGFGQTGPWAHRPGYDFIVQGLSGFMSITGEHDSVPGSGPLKAGTAVSDLFTGMYATVAILAALYHRQATGEGQHIDLALLDVMVASMANVNTNYLTSGVVPGRLGNAHPNVVPYQTFACSDGHLIIAAGNDGQFRKLCVALGCAELADDARFTGNPARLRQRDILIPLLEAATRTRTKAQWTEVLEAAGVPCAPINTLDEVFQNPQLLARGMRIDLPHASGVNTPLVGSPIKMSATPPQYRAAPPMLGQHNEEVFGSLLLAGPDDDRR